MKKSIIAIALFAVLFIMEGCEGSYVVTTQPTTPVFARPVSPGAGYVWIDGDWRWSGNNYVWREGYWGRPRGHRTWVAGSWYQRNNGWAWRRGRWNR
jgi:hypothetical protein